MAAAEVSRRCEVCAVDWQPLHRPVCGDLPARALLAEVLCCQVTADTAALLCHHCWLLLQQIIQLLQQVDQLKRRLHQARQQAQGQLQGGVVLDSGQLLEGVGLESVQLQGVGLGGGHFQEDVGLGDGTGPGNGQLGEGVGSASGQLGEGVGPGSRQLGEGVSLGSGQLEQTEAGGATVGSSGPDDAWRPVPASGTGCSGAVHGVQEQRAALLPVTSCLSAGVTQRADGAVVSAPSSTPSATAAAADASKVKSASSEQVELFANGPDPKPQEKRAPLWHRVPGRFPYRCAICEKQFQYLASVKAHSLTHTGEKKQVCDVCGRRFALQSTLTNHRRLHSGHKPFKCETCDKTFAQQSYLINHRRVHSNDKPFCCEECGKTFKHAYYLNIHKRFHSGEKPYRCDECGKQFATVSNLYKHARQHNGGRQFCCEECGKTFREHCQLRDHRRTHTGERPFTCTVCGMSFSLAKILARHARLHSGERPYSCSVCSKRFARSENMREHMRLHEAAPAPQPSVAGLYAAVDTSSVGDPVSLQPASNSPLNSAPQAAEQWPPELLRTVTAYKTLSDVEDTLYQTETGEVYRNMADALGMDEEMEVFGGAGELPMAQVSHALPAYDGLGI